MRKINAGRLAALLLTAMLCLQGAAAVWAEDTGVVEYAGAWKVTLPSDWAGRYFVRENGFPEGTGWDFISALCDEETPGSGVLFTVISTFEVDDNWPDYELVGFEDGFYTGVMRPTDVQFNPESSRATEEYMSMSEDIGWIISAMQHVDEIPPEYKKDEAVRYTNPDPDCPPYDKGWFIDAERAADQNLVLPGTWICTRDGWTQESLDAFGVWTITFGLDGTMELADEWGVFRTGTYRLNVVPSEPNPVALAHSDDRLYVVSVYHMAMEVYGMPEVTCTAADGSEYTTKTWGFRLLSDTEVSGNSDGWDDTSPDDSIDNWNDASADNAPEFKNYEMEIAAAQGNEICVFITQGNDFVPEEFWYEVTFLDEQGNVLGVSSDIMEMLPSHRTAVSRIEGPPDFFYVDYMTGINDSGLHLFEDYAAYTDSLAIPGDSHTELIVYNNSDAVLEELEYVPLFRKDGNLVYAGECRSIKNFPPGSSFTEVYNNPADPLTNERIEFDDCKIYINKAYARRAGA